MTLHLHALGHFHPEIEITNAFLEELDIGTSDAWIMERVGIRSRRTVLPLDYIRETRNRDPRAAPEAAVYSNAELGRRAAEMALARAGLSAGDIGLAVGGSCAPDWVSPAEACAIACELGIEAPAFNVDSACTSFFAGVDVLAKMRPEALPDYVLLVVPDAMTRTVHYGDRTTAVLWGDAAVAAVLSARVPGRAQIVGSRLQSSPASHDRVVVPRLGHFRQDGRAVQGFAVRTAARELQALREAHEEEDRPLHFVGHQVNRTMLESVCRRCEIPPERHHMNVEWYGNTGAASAASVVSMSWEKWRDCDDVAMVGVGAGLTWASFLLRFEAGA